jgi:hypothetical protein
MLTAESVPGEVGVDDIVVGTTVNSGGRLVVREGADSSACGLNAGPGGALYGPRRSGDLARTGTECVIGRSPRPAALSLCRT